MRLTLLIASVLLVSSTAFAQVGPDVEDPWETARSYYSEGNYAEAQRYIVESIQREPRNPMYYAGLARARWGQGDVDQAVYYYDVFLSELADEVTADIPVSYRPSSIRTERDQANAEREDPDAPVDAPEHLVAAMDALNQRIVDGPILNSTGGGALALYRGLLRSGYAHPSLVPLRERLSNAIVAEANTVVSDHQASIPSLSLVQWETQRDRLAAWQGFAQPVQNYFSDIPASALDPALVGRDQASRVQAHLQFAQAQIQYLNQNWGQASLSFATALESLDDFVPARLGRLNSLLRAGNAATAARTEVDELEALLRRVDLANVGIASVYRAAFAAQRNDSIAAADALGALFGLERPGL